MGMNKDQLVEFISAVGCCVLMIVFTLMVLDGWSSSDYQHDLCEQRAQWEATGHEYVGIPAIDDDGEKAVSRPR